MTTKKKLLVVNVAALGGTVTGGDTHIAGLPLRGITPVFPAVTCVAQASFRTGEHPAAHGMVANGIYDRPLRKVLFWEQAASLVAGRRIWDGWRERGKTVGIMFWQQSLGEQVDLVLSPRPIHKHSGGMLQSCYTAPPELEHHLNSRLGRPFNLFHYWGPLASKKSSEWIAEATLEVMRTPDLAPDLLLTYLPHLDYDLQRYGPTSRQAARAWTCCKSLLEQLIQGADTNGYEVLIFGDYCIDEATGGAVFPNRALRERGLMKTHKVKRMAYPDLFASEAFAMVDHAVAHVYTMNNPARDAAATVLEGLPGVERVIPRAECEGIGLNHPRAGDLVLEAAEGHWFAYPWWTERAEEPDFAGHVDIHNKPGYDPCELFFGWPPLSVSRHTERVRGCHGKSGGTRRVWWAGSLDLTPQTEDFVGLAKNVGKWLDETG